MPRRESVDVGGLGARYFGGFAFSWFTISAPRIEMDKQKMVIIVTRAAEEPERTTVPFVMANAAMAEDMAVTLVLQFEGVWLAVKDYAKNINVQGFPPLEDLLKDFFELGGVMMACTPCLKTRSITDDKLITGTRLAAAGTVVAEAASAVCTLTY